MATSRSSHYTVDHTEIGTDSPPHAETLAAQALLLAGLAWYLKPLIGVVTDAFPLFGSRRRGYLLVGATLATLAWLATIVTPHIQTVPARTLCCFAKVDPAQVNRDKSFWTDLGLDSLTLIDITVANEEAFTIQAA